MKIKVILTVIIILAVSLSTLTQAAIYGGGSGTQTDPYQIWTPQQMNTIGANLTDLGKCFKLMANIDMSAYTGTNYKIIGTWFNPFTGKFDGNEHVIRNLTYNTTAEIDNIGLFGYIKNATILNLGVENAFLSSDGTYIGCLVGYNESGILINCYAMGSVNGTDGSDIGGLVGENWYGTLTGCHATASVNGYHEVGGLVGMSFHGSLTSCHATGSVNGNFSVGGLVGYNATGTVSKCYATSSISGCCEVGGLVGMSYDGLLTSCYATGSVSSNPSVDGRVGNVGGLVGENDGGSIISCYATGSVSIIGANSCVGGLVGKNYYSPITFCYATGLVSGNAHVDGLVGNNTAGSITSCYWDMQTSCRTTSEGGTGMTTAQMQDINIFFFAGWDFVFETANGIEDIWTMSPGQYPRLTWQADTIPPDTAIVPNVVSMTQTDAENALTAVGLTAWITNVYSDMIAAGTVISQSPTAGTILPVGVTVNVNICVGPNNGLGSGTEEDPYKIGTAADWQTFMTTSANWNKYFILMADLDLRNITLTPVGNSSAKFTGSFNGNGHIIRNTAINIPNSNDVGLFGWIGAGGQVKKLGVKNVNIIGGDDVGGLVGENSGLLTDCYATGSVSGTGENSTVGGLTGNQSGGAINHCYSTGSVTSFSDLSFVGGLVGQQGDSGIITNCYSTAIITTRNSGNTSIGGLVGQGGNNVINSFWDIQTSGLDISAGGDGRTTDQMKQSANYIGWNTPTQPNWIINESMDYPRLAWENLPGTLLPIQTLSDFIAGLGTTDNPYQISTPQQLNAIGLFPDEWSKVFCLENDIDLSAFTGTEFNRIGINSGEFFSGTFDGNGYVIRNLTYTTISVVDYVGLFGYIDSNAIIQNLGIENGIFSTGGAYIGSLVGCQNNGTVTHCYSTGSVTATSDSYAGSLVGYQSSGSITYCYSTGSVTAASDSYVGGLVGSSTGIITNCYSTGSVTSPSYAGGLVGYLSDNGAITDCYSTSSVASDSYAGGLVGYQSSGSITHCYSASSVASPSYAGGLVGAQYGTMTHCYSTSSVTSSYVAGGLVGIQSFGTIENCYSTGSVSSSSADDAYAGGLTGYQDFGGKTINCYSTSSVISNSDSDACAGGLIGYMWWGSTVTNCYSRGLVISNADSNAYAGGLVGGQNTGTITNCYSTGSVTSNAGSNAYAGGLVGRYGNIITKCYSTGPVSATGSSIYQGGLLGLQHGSDAIATACFWDTETSGLTTSAGGAGVQSKTTEEMMTLAAFTLAGWDFSQRRIDGDFQDWILVSEGTEYPRLRFQVPFTYHGGNGTTDNPYQIADRNDILALADAWWDWDRQFILTSDIDMAGIEFSEAIIALDIDNGSWDFEGTPFTGLFNGNSHKISNFTIISESSDYLGLFGYAKNAAIENLGIENVDISAGGDYTGTLAGYLLNSTVTYCYTTGSVTTSHADFYSCVGGLVGCQNTGTIANCYSTCEVMSKSDSEICAGGFGGLVGENLYGTIIGCCATGPVSGTDYASEVGGLVGENLYGTITACYATGPVNGTGEYTAVGGLVGRNDEGSLTSCYATGLLSSSYAVGGLIGLNYSGSVTSSFWDTQTNGLTDGVGNQNPDPTGATGLETPAMMTLSTFTSAGWDFTNETANGTGDIWRMCTDGVNYPRLTWQFFKHGDLVCPNGVEMEDMALFVDHWLGIWQLDSDIVDDSIVNMMDLSVVSQNWMQTGCGDCSGADVTGDGNVDVQDITVLADQWLYRENPDCQQADIDNSGTVDLADLSILAANWMMGI